MRLTLLKPYGYCEGVAFALKQLDKIITNHQGQKIYLIG
jgi:4-hydroxy-3-methylbut-2-enyl diphosphate reductase IspH